MHVFIYEYFTGFSFWCLICWIIIIVVIVIIVIVHTLVGVALRYYYVNYEGENVSHYILVTYVHT